MARNGERVVRSKVGRYYVSSWSLGTKTQTGNKQRIEFKE